MPMNYGKKTITYHLNRFAKEGLLLYNLYMKSAENEEFYINM